MTSPPTQLQGQFNVPPVATLRRVATTIRKTAQDGASTWPWRQATVVSSDGGSPPTCTISFDGGVTTQPGVRRLKSYTPVAGELVEVWVRAGGSPLIIGAMA